MNVEKAIEGDMPIAASSDSVVTSALKIRGVFNDNARVRFDWRIYFVRLLATSRKILIKLVSIAIQVTQNSATDLFTLVVRQMVIS